MKRSGSKTKVQIISSDDDFYDKDDLNQYKAAELLSVKVQAMLRLLSIPFGNQFGQDSDVDPTGGLLLFVIDVISALRDVVRLYKYKDSTMAKTVGSRLVSSLTGEIGKLVIYSLTNDWGDETEVTKCFHQVGKRILVQFPEMTTRRHRVSGKMLIHHTCLKSHSALSVDYIQSLIEICPASVSSPDSHGALPIHWCLRNKFPSVEVLRLLIRSYPKGPATRDKKGFIPLHWAVHQASPNFAIVEELLHAYPEGAKEPCGTGGLPLHWAVNHDNPSLPVVMLLYKYFPDAIRTPCKEGWLPIHRAVDRPSPNLEVISFLIEQFPECLKRPCKYGQLPLHKAIEHAVDSFDSVALLLELYPKAAKVGDQDGYLPLHVALDTRYPDEDIVERLIQLYPEAARRPTVDGLLPLHMAIGTNLHPPLRIVAALMQVHPQACNHEVIDYIPKDETANAATWQGEWVETRWTPLSRAIDRELVDVVTLIKFCLDEQGLVLASGLSDDYPEDDTKEEKLSEKGEVRESTDANTSTDVDDEGQILVVSEEENRKQEEVGPGVARWFGPDSRLRAVRSGSASKRDSSSTTTRNTSSDQTPVRLRPIASNPNIVRTSPLYGGRLPHRGATPPRQSSRRRAEEHALPTISESIGKLSYGSLPSLEDTWESANDDKSIRSEVSQHSGRSLIHEGDLSPRQGSSGDSDKALINVTRARAVSDSLVANSNKQTLSQTSYAMKPPGSHSGEAPTNNDNSSPGSKACSTGKSIDSSPSSNNPKSKSASATVASVLKMIGKIPILASAAASNSSTNDPNANSRSKMRQEALPLPPPPSSSSSSNRIGIPGTITVANRHPSHSSLISNLSDSDKSLTDSLYSASEACSDISTSVISEERSSDGDLRARTRFKQSNSQLRAQAGEVLKSKGLEQHGKISGCFSSTSSIKYSRSVNLGPPLADAKKGDEDLV